MYHYNAEDKKFLLERVDQFEKQLNRYLSGELDEAKFRSLRLRNGLYMELHAHMLRIAIPYGILSSNQLRALADVADKYDRGFGHLAFLIADVGLAAPPDHGRGPYRPPAQGRRQAERALLRLGHSRRPQGHQHGRTRRSSRRDPNPSDPRREGGHRQIRR